MKDSVNTRPAKNDPFVMFVPGLVVTELGLDDRGKWPGVEVLAWTKKGRGYQAQVSAPSMIWLGVQHGLDAIIENEGASKNAARTAMARFLVALKQELR
tara:strand:- start:764 stop:1060 length:297 start_codon:yes stop_codon:yes gene_type:complete